MRLLLALLVALAVGCSGKGINDSDPTALFKEAEQDIKNDRYVLAIEKLRTVKNKFPYSNVATDAQLRLADVYFLQESFAEAALSYQGFVDLHPKHERVSYAMFRIGLSYFNDSPSLVARDQSSMQKASDGFEAFLRRFPNAPETQEARQKSNDAIKQLAEKELYVANFYYKNDEWLSAKNRYQKILTLYPQSEAAKTAKERLPRVDLELAKGK